MFANTWHPRGRGKAHFLTSVEAFRHAEQELPRQRNHATAIYLTRECEYIHEGHVTHSAGWNSSSLTMFLDARFGDACGAYAALVLHLRTVLLRNAPCLGGRPFHAAWEQVIHGRDGAVERVMAYVRPYLPHSFIAEPTSIVPQVAGTFHLSQRPRPDHIST